MKILNRKTVFDANLFTVDAVDLQFENNEQATWHTVAMKHPSVFIVPLTDDNQVYLISQYRPLLQKRHFEVSAGFLNDGEVSLDAAKRELREETGLSAENWHELQPVQLTSSTVRAQIHIFLAKGLTAGRTEREPAEEISVAKMPMVEAIEKVLSGEIDDGPSIIALLLINTLLQQRKL